MANDKRKIYIIENYWSKTNAGSFQEALDKGLFQGSGVYVLCSMKLATDSAENTWIEIIKVNSLGEVHCSHGHVAEWYSSGFPVPPKNKEQFYSFHGKTMSKKEWEKEVYREIMLRETNDCLDNPKEEKN